MRKDLEIYVHIPFCIRKCAYCDFFSAPAEREVRERYIEALKTEIRRGRPFCAPAWPETDPGRYRVVSVFFGGGTPSLLSPGQIGEILDTVRTRFALARDAEITMECNPGTTGQTAGDTDSFGKNPLCKYDFEKETEHMKAYRECGVNRLSLGLQSASNQELSLLGRIHTWEDFLRSFQAARAAGFENISVDLMSALPGQTVDSWKHTLQSVLALEPEHISAYSLIIEEGTPFYKRYHEDDRRRAAGEKPLYLPSEDEERAMYEQTGKLLQEHGFIRYEISNYARVGFACRHNIGYWRGTQYLGFGAGASSMVKMINRNAAPGLYGEMVLPYRTVRFKNPENLDLYLRRSAAPAAGKASLRFYRFGTREFLTVQEEMEEFMFLGLRLISGVWINEFRARFGIPIEEIYGDVIHRLTVARLLGQDGERLFLTERGLDLANYVMSEFCF